MNKTAEEILNQFLPHFKNVQQTVGTKSAIIAAMESYASQSKEVLDEDWEEEYESFMKAALLDFPYSTSIPIEKSVDWIKTNLLSRFNSLNSNFYSSEDWKWLQKKFFAECVNEYFPSFSYKVDFMKPEQVFEWFKTNILNRSPVMQWVKASERLPDVVSLLAYTGGLKITLTYIDGIYYCPDGSRWCNEVTHWIPLPPAPNEESNVSSQEPDAIGQVLEDALLGLGSAKAIIDDTNAMEIDTPDNGAMSDCYQNLIEAMASIIKFQASKEIGEPLVQNKSNQ